MGADRFRANVLLLVGALASGCGGSSSANRVNADAGSSVASVDRCVTLTMDPFDVAPGDESYKCQQFSNPFGGDVDLLSTDGTASDGVVRYYVFSMSPDTGRTATAPLNDCPGRGLELHAAPFMSQQPQWSVTYPRPEMGYPIPAANGVMLDTHYLNLGSAPIHAAVSATLCTAKAGIVTTHVGTIFLYNASLDVPPTPMSSPVTSDLTFDPTKFTGLGTLPASYAIFSSWGYMTSRGVELVATTGGSVIYDQRVSSAPPRVEHDPPVAMTGTQPIAWSCRYYNDRSDPLMFGDSAVTNAWCVYMAGYAPADRVNPDVVAVVFQ